MYRRYDAPMPSLDNKWLKPLLWVVALEAIAWAAVLFVKFGGAA